MGSLEQESGIAPTFTSPEAPNILEPIILAALDTAFWANMHSSLSEFWTRFRSGLDIAVGSADSEKLLGVRDGFLRYFHEGLERPVPVSVASVPDPEDGIHLPLSDEEILLTARDRALELRSRFGDLYAFYACSEMGLHALDLDGKTLYFVRNWTVICGPGGEACGGSGSVQLPQPLIEGLEADQIQFAVPGTRRRGGMTASLTGGLETRRQAVAVATLHALSSLLWGLVERRPVRSRL